MLFIRHGSCVASLDATSYLKCKGELYVQSVHIITCSFVNKVCFVSLLWAISSETKSQGALNLVIFMKSQWIAALEDTHLLPLPYQHPLVLFLSPPPCVCVRVRARKDSCVKTKEQLVKVTFLLPLCRSWGSNSGCRASSTFTQWSNLPAHKVSSLKKRERFMYVYVRWCVCGWMCLHLHVCAWPAEARRGFQILLELEIQAMVSHH